MAAKLIILSIYFFFFFLLFLLAIIYSHLMGYQFLTILVPLFNTGGGGWFVGIIICMHHYYYCYYYYYPKSKGSLHKLDWSFLLFSLAHGHGSIVLVLLPLIIMDSCFFILLLLTMSAF